ncbi:MAG: ChbG/HpnK family deacetylase [Magnetococcus sp. DMHC-6]
MTIGLRRLIVNADDFGLSEGVNQGILLAFAQGVVRSTTLLANMAGFDHAVGLARLSPGLGVGVHLNLTWGRPVTPVAEVASLVDGEGNFFGGPGPLLWRYLAGRVALHEVYRECVAQIRRVLEAGIVPTHVDTHHHLHAFPGLSRAVIQAATAEGVWRMRWPLAQGSVAGRSWGRVGMKKILSVLLVARLKRTLLAGGVWTPDLFFDPGVRGMNVKEIPLWQGVAEWGCHPALLEPVGLPCLGRVQELAHLIDPALRQALMQAGISLIHYGELKN